MRRGLVALAVLAALLAGLLGTQFTWGSTRYLLGVKLVGFGQSLTGSTVWHISGVAGPRFLHDPNGGDWSVKGEAIEIPLGNDETLFVLKRPVTGVPNDTFGQEYRSCVFAADESIYDEHKLLASLGAVRKPCFMELFPRLVIANKDGIVRELPYDFRTGSGPEIELISTVAVATDQPLSRGIANRHPWIRALPHRSGGGRPDVIYYEDFEQN